MYFLKLLIQILPIIGLTTLYLYSKILQRNKEED